MKQAKRRPLNDDISPCAGDDGLNLCLLGLGHSELVERLLEISAEKAKKKPRRGETGLVVSIFLHRNASCEELAGVFQRL